MNITNKKWGEFNNADVVLFTLKNAAGTVVEVMNFGAIVTSIRPFGGSDVLLGFNSFEGYRDLNVPYLNCVVGRVGGRIAEGKLMLPCGQTFTLFCNSESGGKKCHLHGGKEGFSKRLWYVVGTKTTEKFVSVTFGIDSPDGDQGYPGNLHATIEYSLTEVCP